MLSFNEPAELQAFRSYLDPERFDVVDIRALATGGQVLDGPARLQEGWLQNACRPGMRCDLVVYSAEFAGRFFGKEGMSLSLQEMEEASCQARCAGLFHQPREVFLLACNTLATKDEDSRTPEQYLQVLLGHDFDRASAERVVELRYGPLGPSFREALRRIFAGVPRLYGFSSVAPRGAYSAPMLARYLRGQPDYAGTLLRPVPVTSRNTALLSSFRSTSLVQTSGLSAKEAGAVDRVHICALYDESLPVVDRLRIAYAFMMRPDALAFVPTLQVFLSRHPPSSLTRVEASFLAEIHNLDAARDAVMELVRQLNVSALKLELAHFAVLVGWLAPQEFHVLAVDGARKLLQEPLTAEVVDIMCEITKHESLRGDFRVDDIPARVYGDPQGLRLLSCLAPSDPRVAPRVIPALNSPDLVRREWAAHALTRLQPRDEAVLKLLVPYLRNPSPEVAERVRWLFQSQGALPRSVEDDIDRLGPDLRRQQSAVPIKNTVADGGL